MENLGLWRKALTLSCSLLKKKAFYNAAACGAVVMNLRPRCRLLEPIYSLLSWLAVMENIKFSFSACLRSSLARVSCVEAKLNGEEKLITLCWFRVSNLLQELFSLSRWAVRVCASDEIASMIKNFLSLFSSSTLFILQNANIHSRLLWLNERS